MKVERSWFISDDETREEVEVYDLYEELFTTLVQSKLTATVEPGSQHTGELILRSYTGRRFEVVLKEIV